MTGPVFMCLQNLHSATCFPVSNLPEVVTWKAGHVFPSAKPSEVPTACVCLPKFYDRSQHLDSSGTQHVERMRLTSEA